MAKDRTKTGLAILMFASMFVLPPIILGIGWTGWSLRTGVVSALATVTICFLSGGLLLATVQNPTWITVWIPFFMGAAYVVLPDILTGNPFDDGAVVAAGSLFTFALWLRKEPDTPKWVVFPLMVSALYTMVGGFIPGPVDELLVMAISSGGSFAASRIHRPLAAGSHGTAREGQVIDADLAVSED